MNKDDLGDRMKAYERHETGRLFLPMLPVYARIDGRGFSKFTRGMDRPYDQRMTDAMVETTKYLVRETHARIGYVQSDEISLAWMAEDYTSSIFFDGKITKMTSVLAAMATAAFNRAIRGWEPYEDRFPAFDARVIQMPKPYEVANMFLWRAQDATKNAVSMACRHFYSAKEMHGKDQAAMIQMMADMDIRFEDYPAEFRRGTWVRRVTETRELSPAELARIPEGKRPPEGHQFVRSDVRSFTIDQPMSAMTNRTEFIFDAAQADFTKGGSDDA